MRNGLSLGVYGLRLRGLNPPARLLSEVAATAPLLTVSRVERTEQLPTGKEILASPLIGGGEVRMALDTGEAFYKMPHDVPDGEMLHPWLSPVAFWFSRYLQRIVIHGGVLARGDRAVAVVGDREAGKSTLTAWASTGAHGLDVMSDDVVVIENGRVFAGPRCIDLRPSAIPWLPQLKTEPARDGTRYRVELPSCAPSAHLVGIVVLSWAQELCLELVPPVLRVPTLAEHLFSGPDRAAADRVLSLAEMPVWRLERPKGWHLIDETLAQIVDKVLEG